MHFQAQWAEMAIFASELELIDGEKVNDANEDWDVSLVWKNRDIGGSNTDTTCDTLRRIILVDDGKNVDTKLQKGQNLDIITDPVAFQLNFDGLTLGAADYDTVTLSQSTYDSDNPLHISRTSNCSDYVNATGDMISVKSPTKDYFEVGGNTVKEFLVDYNGTGWELYYKPSGITGCQYSAGNAATSGNIKYDPGDGQQNIVVSNRTDVEATINITEDSGNTQNDYMVVLLNSTDNFASFDYNDDHIESTDSFGVMKTREPVFISDRGSQLTSLSKDSVGLKIAKKVAEAQYYLKTSGTSATSGVDVGPLEEGQSASVSGGVVVKVKSITETVGSCQVSGATCTVDDSGVTATLSTGGSSVQAVTIFPIESNLVVLDSSNPTGPMISVGGPDVNTVTKAAVGGANVQWAAGTKIKQAFGDVIVVAGGTGADTQAAAQELIQELRAGAGGA